MKIPLTFYVTRIHIEDYGWDVNPDYWVVKKQWDTNSYLVTFFLFWPFIYLLVNLFDGIYWLERHIFYNCIKQPKYEDRWKYFGSGNRR